MGIDLSGLRAIGLAVRAAKADFTTVATLARHEIHFTRSQFERVMAASGNSLRYIPEFGPYHHQEALLQGFGAETIVSFDGSAYEGASVVADFNQPLPEAYRGKFSTYFDFGSMEHVFNVKQVLENIQFLLGIGGTAVVLTSCDGQAAHGLYQFSPEFFYSAFSQATGYSGTRVFLVDIDRPKRWLAIASPTQLGRRNAIPAGHRFYVICIAKKVADCSAITVQQSDYERSAWGEANHRHCQPPQRSTLFRAVIDRFPNLAAAAKGALVRKRMRKRFRSHTTDFDPDGCTCLFDDDVPG